MKGDLDKFGNWVGDLIQVDDTGDFIFDYQISRDTVLQGYQASEPTLYGLEENLWGGDSGHYYVGYDRTLLEEFSVDTTGDGYFDYTTSSYLTYTFTPIAEFEEYFISEYGLISRWALAEIEHAALSEIEQALRNDDPYFEFKSSSGQEIGRIEERQDLNADGFAEYRHVRSDLFNNDYLSDITMQAEPTFIFESYSILENGIETTGNSLVEENVSFFVAGPDVYGYDSGGHILYDDDEGLVLERTSVTLDVIPYYDITVPVDPRTEMYNTSSEQWYSVPELIHDDHGVAYFSDLDGDSIYETIWIFSQESFAQNVCIGVYYKNSPGDLLHVDSLNYLESGDMFLPLYWMSASMNFEDMYGLTVSALNDMESSFVDAARDPYSMLSASRRVDMINTVVSMGLNTVLNIMAPGLGSLLYLGWSALYQYGLRETILDSMAAQGRYNAQEPIYYGGTAEEEEVGGISNFWTNLRDDWTRDQPTVDSNIVDSVVYVQSSSPWWGITPWRDIGTTSSLTEPVEDLLPMEIQIPVLPVIENELYRLMYAMLRFVREKQYDHWIQGPADDYGWDYDDWTDQYSSENSRDLSFLDEEEMAFVEGLYQQCKAIVEEDDPFKLELWDQLREELDSDLSNFLSNLFTADTFETFWDYLNAARYFAITLSTLELGGIEGNDISSIIPNRMEMAEDFFQADVSGEMAQLIYEEYWYELGENWEEDVFSSESVVAQVAAKFAAEGNIEFTTLRFQLDRSGRPIFLPSASPSHNISNPIERFLDFSEVCYTGIYWELYNKETAFSWEITLRQLGYATLSVLAGVISSNIAAYAMNPTKFLSQFQEIQGTRRNLKIFGSLLGKVGEQVIDEMIVEECTSRLLTGIGFSNGFANFIAEYGGDSLTSMRNAISGRYQTSQLQNIQKTLDGAYSQGENSETQSAQFNQYQQQMQSINDKFFMRRSARVIAQLRAGINSFGLEKTFSNLKGKDWSTMLQVVSLKMSETTDAKLKELKIDESRINTKKYITWYASARAKRKMVAVMIALHPGDRAAAVNDPKFLKAIGMMTPDGVLEYETNIYFLTTKGRYYMEMDGTLWQWMGNRYDKIGTFSDQIDTSEIISETWVDPKKSKKKDYKKNPIVVEYTDEQHEMPILSEIFKDTPKNYQVGQDISSTINTLKDNNKVFAESQKDIELAWYKKQNQKLVDEFLFEEITGKSWARISEIGYSHNLEKSTKDLIEFDLISFELKDLLDQDFHDLPLAECISLSILKKKYSKSMDPDVAKIEAEKRLQAIKDKIKSSPKGTIADALYNYDSRFSIPWEVMVDAKLTAAIQSPSNELIAYYKIGIAMNIKTYQELYSAEFSLDQFMSHSQNADEMYAVQNDYYRIFQLLEHFTSNIFGRQGSFYGDNAKNKANNRPGFLGIADYIISDHPTGHDIDNYMNGFFRQYSLFKKQMEAYSPDFDSTSFLSKLMTDKKSFASNIGPHRGISFAEWLGKDAKDASGEYISYKVVTTEVQYTVKRTGEIKTRTEYDLIFGDTVIELGENQQIVEEGSASGEMTMLDLLASLGNAKYIGRIVGKYFNSEMHSKYDVFKSAFHSQDEQKANFARRWGQYYKFLIETAKKPKRQGDYIQVKDDKLLPYSPTSASYVAKLINRLYHSLICDSEDLLPEDTNSLRKIFATESDFDRNSHVFLSTEQFNALDQILVIFAQMFSFVDPSEINLPDPSEGDTDFSSGLSELAGFNSFLSSISEKYKDSNDNLLPQFSGSWAPFLYKLGGLNLNFDLIASRSSGSRADWARLKWTLSWPTPSNPDNTVKKGYMSPFEGRSFPFWERLIMINKLVTQSLVTNFHSSRDMSSLMHYKKDAFSNTGQIDFSALLLGNFPIVAEFMGAGRTMRVMVGGVLTEINYGDDTNEKIGIQVGKLIPTIAVAYSPSTYQYYADEQDHVGKDCPSITERQFYSLLTAMALVYHPDIRPLIETARPGMYDPSGEFKGDPLKIALYMLQCDISMPAIDWETGGIMKSSSGQQINQPFYQICGFSSQEMACIVQERFGLKINEDYTRSRYLSTGLEEWWDNRDILIGWLINGICSSSNSDHQAVFDLISTPT